MSQLVATPGRNAARQAKRLKEIRKVQGAIKYHERERKQRQKVAFERWEARQARISQMKYKYENTTRLKRRALEKVREDWKLGPLRPNRAVGQDADKYGTYTQEQAQTPQIPVHMQKSLNEYRIKKGLEPDYPLVVDDEKYFHIEKDDRVIVINGRERGKIGIVQDVLPRSHEVFVKGVNKQYYDSAVFNNVAEDVGPRSENEVPIPIADIRLVIPYPVPNGEATGKSVITFQDVIVENVTMERHTTGIDPFTGINYGTNEIPKEHQYDPVSGLPIFHRYIAGTRHRIEWPWEKEEESEQSSSATKGKSSKAKRTWLQTLRHPIRSILDRKNTSSEPKLADPVQADKPPTVQKTVEEMKELERKRLTEVPKSKDLEPHDAWDFTDTTRNIVETADSMHYTLVYPPFPTSLSDEVREGVSEMRREERKQRRDERASEARPIKIKTKYSSGNSLVARELSRAKQATAQTPLQRMKTPMQLRWEVEQAKKLELQKTAPVVDTEELMRALGKHMLLQKGGVGKAVSKARAVGGDVD